MGLLPLTYRRPARVELPPRRGSSTSANTDGQRSDESLRSGSSGNSQGIPPALSFDRIIDGGTCPPCTVRDFMNYLIYIERAAENLQFYLWLRDYTKRFKEANTSDMALAQEWTQAMEDEAVARIQKENMEKMRRGPKTGPAAEILKGTDFEKRSDHHVAAADSTNPFSTPPRTPHDGDNLSAYNSSNGVSHRTQASEAYAAAGIKPPFTIQPFREEIDRVIVTYIMDDAPRQLNLSSREQKAVLQALAYTTHPSAFRVISKSIESSLRRQAHPNFIRWSICNGNPARVHFAQGLGIATILIGIVVALVLTLSRAGRGYRALAAIAFVIGIATLIAGYKGMCVVLHGLHHQHIRPWELFMTDDNLEELGKSSFDSFGSANSYEEQPWVIKYEKRNVIRKIFDREVWIKEPALRQIQDTIFVQSMLCALVLAAFLTAIFVAVPGGNFF